MSTGDTMLTPNQVVLKLAGFGRDLDSAVKALQFAEQDAVKKRHAADMAESRAFLAADGPMDVRKHTARVEAGPLEEQALVAEAVLRYLKTQIRAIDTQIEIGRSYGAAVRAELKSFNYGEGS